MDNQNILVVEDEEEIQELVRYNLRNDGYGVVCAGTGEDALKQARANAPDLIVLDLMLPGLDGLEVCRKLKEDPKTREIAIVMLTAKSADEDKQQGMEAGANLFLPKPISPQRLIQLVDEVVQAR